VPANKPKDKESKPIEDPAKRGGVDSYFEIKRAHSLKVRPCLEYYSLAWKNAINRIIDNTLKDYL